MFFGVFVSSKFEDEVASLFFFLFAGGPLYNVHAKHTSNSGFDRTFMPCSGYFLCAAEQRAGNQISWVVIQHEANRL